MSFPKWPSWRFGPGGQSAVFESEADVPNGWVDHPTKVDKAPKPAPPAKTADDKPPAKRAGRPKKAKVVKPAPPAKTADDKPAKPLDL
jgi:hypothetical protein